VQLLLNYHADKTIPNSQNETPLDVAEKKGHRNVVELLLDVGLDTAQTPTTQSSFAISSMSMADPTAIASFRSDASTQLDDPMQGSTFIEQPARRGSPASATLSRDQREHSVDSEPTQVDTFAPQRGSRRVQDLENDERARAQREGPRRRLPDQSPPPQQQRQRQPSPKPEAAGRAQGGWPQPEPSYAPAREDRLEDFLREVGLDPERYLQVFADEEIDFEALMTLQEKHLIDLGLKMGPRNKILAGIARLQTAAGTAELHQPPFSSTGSSPSSPTRLPGSHALQPASTRSRPLPFHSHTPPQAHETPRGERETRSRGPRAVPSEGENETSETDVSEHEPVTTPSPTRHKTSLPVTLAHNAGRALHADQNGEDSFHDVGTLFQQPHDDGRGGRGGARGDDPGYQSTVEISPEKWASASMASTTLAPTTLASTIILPNTQRRDTTSQLLSEIGYSSARRLSPEKSAPISPIKSPKKTSPTKFLKAPNFIFSEISSPPSTSSSPSLRGAPARSHHAKDLEQTVIISKNQQQQQQQQQPPARVQTPPKAPSQSRPQNSTITQTQIAPSTQSQTLPQTPPRQYQVTRMSPPQGQPFSSSTTRHHQPPKAQEPSKSPGGHFELFMSAVNKTPILNFIADHFPKNATSISVTDAIRLELKPLVIEVSKPEAFVTVEKVTDDQRERVGLKVTAAGNVLTYKPKTWWEVGGYYSVTLHAHQAKVIDSNVKDASWMFFVH